MPVMFLRFNRNRYVSQSVCQTFFVGPLLSERHMVYLISCLARRSGVYAGQPGSYVLPCPFAPAGQPSVHPEHPVVLIFCCLNQVWVGQPHVHVQEYPTISALFPGWHSLACGLLQHFASSALSLSRGLTCTRSLVGAYSSSILLHPLDECPCGGTSFVHTVVFSCSCQIQFQEGWLSTCYSGPAVRPENLDRSSCLLFKCRGNINNGAHQFLRSWKTVLALKELSQVPSLLSTVLLC